jgi:hypothetical protein
MANGWKSLRDRQRQELLRSRLPGVRGVWQREGSLHSTTSAARHCRKKRRCFLRQCACTEICKPERVVSGEVECPNRAHTFSQRHMNVNPRKRLPTCSQAVELPEHGGFVGRQVNHFLNI